MHDVLGNFSVGDESLAPARRLLQKLLRTGIVSSKDSMYPMIRNHRDGCTSVQLVSPARDLYPAVKESRLSPRRKA